MSWKLDSTGCIDWTIGTWLLHVAKTCSSTVADFQKGREHLDSAIQESQAEGASPSVTQSLRLGGAFLWKRTPKATQIQGEGKLRLCWGHGKGHVAEEHVGWETELWPFGKGTLP